MNTYLVTIKFNQISGAIMEDKMLIIKADSFQDANKKATKEAIKKYPNAEWIKCKDFQLLK